MAALRIGQILKGRCASYIVEKSLRRDETVFKAHVKSDVPSSKLSAYLTQAQQLSVKKVPTNSMNRRLIKIQLKSPINIVYTREVENYGAGATKKSPYIRSLLDLISHDAETSSSSQPQCMVFEWMDTDLWQLPSENFRSGFQLSRIVARSMLKALDVLNGLGGIHIDLNCSPMIDFPSVNFVNNYAYTRTK